jgi:hypothetical protein
MSGRTALVVFDTLDVSPSERLLVDALRGRGFDVRLAVIPRQRRARPLAASVRRWLEGIGQRREEVAPLASLGAAEIFHSADRLAAFADSVQPHVVFHFADPLAAPAGSFPVYQTWLNGWPQSLRMNGVLSADGGPLRLAVTRRQRGWPAPRTVLRAAVTPSGAIAVTDQDLLARRAVVLLLRALDVSKEEESEPPRPMGKPLRVVGAGVAAFVASISGGLATRWRCSEAWFLAYRLKREPAGDFRILFGGRERFLADPCAVTAGGEDWVFYEDFDYRLGRGAISVSRLQPDGTLSAPARVLEQPYHLSYPCVFESDGWWMVPETSDIGTVDLYRAVEFPFRWKHEARLLNDVLAVDATLHHDGRWWMFVSIGEYRSSTWDELSIFMADELTGPWRPHPRNPVKSNAASSRPAGRLIRRGGRLLRPAQDCSRFYGEAVRFCDIERLTEDDYAEREAEIVPPSLIPGAVALHTWTESENLEVVDARFARAWLDPARFRRQAESFRKKMNA